MLIKTKILYIIPSLGKGGAERIVLDICNALSKRSNLQVKLITFTNINDYSFLTQKIDWTVIPSFVIPSITGKWKVEVDALQKKIDEFKPDIIHSHLFESEIILSKINYNSARYFVHFHDNMVQFENFSYDMFLDKIKLTHFYEKQKVLRAYAKRDTLFISISNDSLLYCNRVLPMRYKKHLLYNAIDLNRFYFPISLNTNTIIPVITTVGSLVDKKGHNLAIDAVTILNKRDYNIFLNIIGDGPNREILQNQISQNHQDDNIKLLGKINNPEFYLQKSLCYLHTALYEPFGLAIVEAMACGLPVICTDGMGNRPLIKDGYNGFMIYDRNPTTIADKLELLLKNDKLRNQMSFNAREFSLNFNIENYVDKLLNIYRLS